MDGIRKRWLDDLLRQALRVMPVVVVTGARQVGKTTLAGGLQPGRRMMTLDDLGVLGQARKAPDSLGPTWSGIPDGRQAGPGVR